MTTAGGPDDDRPALRQRAGSSPSPPDAPPWERPGLPDWLSTTIASQGSPAPPARRHRGAVIALLTVVAVMLAGVGTLVVVRRGGEVDPDGASTNALRPAPTPPSSAAGSAPSTAARPAPPAARTDAQVRARLDWIEQRLAKVRGLAFEHPVPSELLPASKLNEQVLRQVDAETDEARVRAEGRALELLGQVPAGTDLVKLLRDVQVESVLGYYVPGKGPGKGRLFVRAGGGLTPFAEFLLSHELTHAVTDQHFDLSRADRLEAAGREEALVGYLALVEGDATYTMQRYYQQEMSAAEQLSVAQESLSARAPLLDRSPAVVKQSLGFPYQAGMIFVQELYQRGGWAAVNRAYADPPTSSEQILHPDKYLAPRDEPRQVTVPDLRRALGRGWRAGTDRDWGEADARFLLAEQVPVTAAKDAAAGWDGGELRTFRRGDRAALALRTVWDTPREATEFCETMARWATGRLGAPTATARWAGAGQHAALVCAGDRATWLAAPDAATLDRMRTGLGGKP